MFIVVAENYGSTTGHILGKFDVLKDARRIAFWKANPHQRILIYDDSDVKPIVFIPTGQKIKNVLGDKIAEIIQPSAKYFAGTKIYYPKSDSKYYKKHKVKYHEYVLNADGSLGKGKRW